MAMKVEKGDQVKVWYEGSLDDGTIFDKGEIEFTAGGGEMIKGFDDAVIGMKKGQEKKVRIGAKDAYGDADPEKIEEIPLYNLTTSGVMPKEGMEVVVRGQTGRIVRVTKTTATVDFNPNFVGKDLNFKIKMLEINKE